MRKASESITELQEIVSEMLSLLPKEEEKASVRKFDQPTATGKQKKKTVQVIPRRTGMLLHGPKLEVRQLKLCVWRTSDKISELPDDILVHILSLLPIKEAGRTCVLSTRWKDVWAYVPVLNFDPSNIDYEPVFLDDGSFDREKFELEEARYMDWVDKVVCSHKALTINELKVPFNLDDFSRNYIDYWVQTAMEKRVKNLELNFEPFPPDGKDSPYNLPTNTLSSCYSLTSLQLFDVEVTGEALEIIIYNCQALELLSVKQSEVLVDLKVDSRALNLKSLEIVCCRKIKNLEISAPNLKSLNYFGPKLSFNFNSTPKLSQFSASGLYCEHLMHDYAYFSSCISQIEALTLDLPRTHKAIIKVFPTCTRVKVLDFTFKPKCVEELFHSGSLIKACPSLHKFVLQLIYYDEKIKTIKTARKPESSCPHANLKILEIIGFGYCKIDIDFVIYLMEIAVSLEKIILDPRNPIDVSDPRAVGTPWEETETKVVRRARKVANQLKAHLKPGTDLIVR